MTLTPGLDSLQQPTRAQAQALFAAGYRWWGVYVGGPSAAGVWDPATVAMLLSVGFRVLPIWVPSLSLDGDPAADANQARLDALRFGLHGVIGYDTEASEQTNPRLHPYLDASEADHAAVGWRFVVYSGAHYCPPGAFDWSAWWGARPSSLADGTAEQWHGGITVDGVTVDLDEATAAFPLISTAPPDPPPAPPALVSCSIGGKPAVMIPVPIFQLDADGWYCYGVPNFPAGKTKDDIVSVVCDAGSPFSNGWHFCAGAPDFTPETGDVRIVFRGEPGHSFTARIFVTD